MTFRSNSSFALLILCVFCLQSVWAQPARQLGNLRPESLSGASQSIRGTRPANFAILKGIGYFVAEDGEHGEALWRTDGTPEGTWMVVDITPDRSISNIENLLAGENLLYFQANNPNGNGYRLYRSDGTAAGTYPLRDESPRGPANTLERYPLAIVGDQFFFRSNLWQGEAESGAELWVTDGTQPGTRLVKELAPGPVSGITANFTPGVPPGKSGAMLGGKMLFAGLETLAEGSHLWETDGTAAGTRLLKNLVPPEKSANDPAYTSSYADNFLTADGLVYFTAASPMDGYEWWRTDGTAAGTFMLPEFATGRPAVSDWGFSSVRGGTAAVTIGSVLFYAVNHMEQTGATYQYIPGIAYSDGTTNGTHILRYHLDASSAKPVESAGKAWFIAFDQTEDIPAERQWGLWVVTEGSCRFVTPVMPYSGLMAVGNTVYCHNPAYGLQSIDAVLEQVKFGAAIWDDNEEAWSVPSPLLPAVGLEPINFAAFGTLLFFSHYTPEYGLEPWVSDGTPVGTRMLRDINQRKAGSLDRDTPFSGELFLASENTIYFPARTQPGSYVYQLMRFAPGMTMPEAVSGYSLGTWSGNDNWGAEIDGAIICAVNPESEAEPGITQLCVIRGNNLAALMPTEGANDLNRPFGFTRSGTNVFFFAYNSTDGLDLWRTAGTSGTTLKVKSWVDSAHTDWGSLGTIVAADGRIYFALGFSSDTSFSTFNYALFASDGTQEGTYTLAAAVPAFSLPIGNLLPLRTGVLFSTTTGFYYNDGTPDGTALFELFGGLAVPTRAVIGGQLWYMTVSETQEQKLYRSDGTTQGTQLISGGTSSFQGGLEFKGDVYLYNGTGIYVVRNGTTSAELVFSVPSGSGAIYALMAVTEDGIYFTASDLLHGLELWKTDGTAIGTTLVQDICVGSEWSLPYNLRQIGTNIFFTAEDYRGREPWIMPVSSTLPAKLSNVGDLVTITGSPFSFQPSLEASYVETWRWHNLPPGLNYSPVTGLISGIPQMGGTFHLTVDAANAGGTAIASFTLRVVDPDYARISLTPAASPGKLSLSLSAIAGLHYHILTSTDLIHWDTITEDADADFTLPEVNAENGQRFYQVLTVNPR